MYVYYTEQESFRNYTGIKVNFRGHHLLLFFFFFSKCPQLILTQVVHTDHSLRNAVLEKIDGLVSECHRNMFKMGMSRTTGCYGWGLVYVCAVGITFRLNNDLES